MKLVGAGVSVSLPPGWEGEIDPGGDQVGEAHRPTVVHLANFSLPPQRGDYGDGAVQIMRSQDVLMVLLEFVASAPGQPLFAANGLPLPLRHSDFDRNALQRRMEGQGGCQRFFQSNGRAFCLFVVVGSYVDRVDRLDEINEILATVEIT